MTYSKFLSSDVYQEYSNVWEHELGDKVDPSTGSTLTNGTDLGACNRVPEKASKEPDPEIIRGMQSEDMGLKI
ncbi:hypothetical protein BTVI_13814 [Pitangus sulphuratus]|nr:hypothetical protein BTVI_13814 [Pitangus sulphuratus]